MRIRTVTGAWYDGVKFSIQDRERGYVQELKFVKIPEHEMVQESGMMTKEDAQVLMDDLWHCGIRPTEGSGSAGSLKATEYHLEDMRKLVFKEEKK